MLLTFIWLPDKLFMGGETGAEGEDDASDLLQSCTLMFLEMKEEKVNPTQGLKPYFICVLYLQ